MQQTESKTFATLLNGIAAVLFVAGFVLLFQGRQSGALTIGAIGSAIMAFYWGIYLYRRRNDNA